MSLKAKYPDTRGGLKELVRDARPGTRLYTVTEYTATAYIPGGKAYSEWVVTDKKSWIDNTFYVRSPSNGSEITIKTLLSKERAVYGQRPANMPNTAAQVRHETYSDAAHRAAQAVADRHADEAAARLSRQYAGR
ncbi:hypothetical protein [Streptomyces sp. WAC08241]|uniref:hypothetical protein n=1 Tax=Streptomyces sp. WAC08241 TaxID=2487421 RepID=UPI00163D0527|nr:hypothetical protein [Streptomyces sp. WAC08241]